MSAFQIHLYSELEEAVLLGALTLDQAWLLMDEFLVQDSEVALLPVEYAPIVAALEFSQLEQGSLPVQ